MCFWFSKKQFFNVTQSEHETDFFHLVYSFLFFFTTKTNYAEDNCTNNDKYTSKHALLYGIKICNRTLRNMKTSCAKISLKTLLSSEKLIFSQNSIV